MNTPVRLADSTAMIINERRENKIVGFSDDRNPWSFR
jgi:hypothetical protein